MRTNQQNFADVLIWDPDVHVRAARSSTTRSHREERLLELACPLCSRLVLRVPADGLS